MEYDHDGKQSDHDINLGVFSTLMLIGLFVTLGILFGRY
jgi:hypothetical protein